MVTKFIHNNVYTVSKFTQTLFLRNKIYEIIVYSKIFYTFILTIATMYEDNPCVEYCTTGNSWMNSWARLGLPALYTWIRRRAACTGTMGRPLNSCCLERNNSTTESLVGQQPQRVVLHPVPWLARMTTRRECLSTTLLAT
jgi:hypothetical protein